MCASALKKWGLHGTSLNETCGVFYGGASFVVDTGVATSLHAANPTSYRHLHHFISWIVQTCQVSIREFAETEINQFVISILMRLQGNVKKFVKRCRSSKRKCDKVFLSCGRCERSVTLTSPLLHTVCSSCSDH